LLAFAFANCVCVCCVCVCVFIVVCFPQKPHATSTSTCHRCHMPHATCHMWYVLCVMGYVLCWSAMCMCMYMHMPREIRVACCMFETMATCKQGL
jgi:hypothetical protein